MGKKILLGVIAIVLMLLIAILVQPSQVRIERSVVVGAPANEVWAIVSDFNRWPDWNPWQQMDETQVNTIAGNAGTVGHQLSWVGDRSGTGSMTFSAVQPRSRLEFEIKTVKPFRDEATAEISLTPKDSGTQIIWSMDNNNGFMEKAMNLFVGMDKMIGGMYEEGLANLKVLVEA